MTPISREVVELHEFFAAWIGGSMARERAALARFEAALGPGFVMVGPDGRRRGRSEAIAMVDSLHGARPGLEIAIAGFAVLHALPPLTLATYDEIQRWDGKSTARRATTLFRDDPAGPNGVHWLALHETWIAASA